MLQLTRRTRSVEWLRAPTDVFGIQSYCNNNVRSYTAITNRCFNVACAFPSDERRVVHGRGGLIESRGWVGRSRGREEQCNLSVLRQHHQLDEGCPRYSLSLRFSGGKIIKKGEHTQANACVVSNPRENLLCTSSVIDARIYPLASASPTGVLMYCAWEARDHR